jgi:hypothetical protein
MSSITFFYPYTEDPTQYRHQKEKKKEKEEEGIDQE